ncbi:chitin deacetylase, partial [Pseudoloma neurophilia]
DVPATFHFSTQYINRNNIAAKVDQAVDQDHEIGLQLDPSRNYDDMSNEEIKEEITTQLDVLSEATGTKIKYARAPVESGETNQAVYNTLKNKGIVQSYYTVCPYHQADDVESAENYIDSIFKQSNPKYDSFIFQLQDEREKDFPIMEHNIIKKGKKEGYEFVTLQKCLDGYKPGTHVNSKRRSKSCAKNCNSLLLGFMDCVFLLLLI